jgi:plastocyanin
VRGVLVLAIVLTAAAGAVTVAAGGVDEKKDKTAEAAANTGGTPATSVESGSISDQAAVRAHIGATVRMRRLAFKPATVTIREGESVRWVNHDDVLHNVTATTGSGTELAAFKSKSIAPLSTYVTAPRAGTYLYVCTIHPTVMHGKVIVLPS